MSFILRTHMITQHVCWPLSVLLRCL